MHVRPFVGQRSVPTELTLLLRTPTSSCEVPAAALCSAPPCWNAAIPEENGSSYEHYSGSLAPFEVAARGRTKPQSVTSPSAAWSFPSFHGDAVLTVRGAAGSIEQQVRDFCSAVTSEHVRDRSAKRDRRCGSFNCVPVPQPSWYAVCLRISLPRADRESFNFFLFVGHCRLRPRGEARP